jgi:HEAT repeat protein
LLDHREPSRLRAFAAFGLALARSPAAVPGIASVIRDRREDADPRAAALLAAGHLGDEVLAPVVEDALVRPSSGLSSWESACAVAAVGRLGGSAALPILLKAAAHRDAFVRRSAVLALGRFPGGKGTKGFDALTYLAKSDDDRITRAYATIALARTRRPEASTTLLRIAEVAKDSSHRGFALLALGVLARECGDDALSEKVGAFLRRGLVKGRLSQDLEGAVVTALGVMRDRASVPVLLAKLEDDGNPELRGQVAIALAMIGDREALPTLREALDPKGPSELLRSVSLALGLLGDSESTRRLVNLVRHARSEWVRGNAALALGRIGGPEAARAMIAVLSDERSSAPTRGMGAVALGHMLDAREVPALVVLVEDLDYLLPLESIRELLTIL